jgi:hypothetical protein
VGWPAGTEADDKGNGVILFEVRNSNLEKGLPLIDKEGISHKR